MSVKADKDRLVEYCDQRMAELARLLPLALSHGEVKAVHDARVCSRRLTAVVRVFRPLFSGRRRRRLVKALRRVRHRLGRLRDLDVQIEHLQSLNIPAQRPAARWVLHHLTGQRRALAAKNRSKRPCRLDRTRIWQRLRCQLAGTEEVDACLEESLRGQVAEFSQLADSLAALDLAKGNTATGASPPGGDKGTAPRATPHSLRIAGKSLRYTLELAAAAGHPVPPNLFRTFKRMQDLLGLWHDYVVLADAIVELSLEHTLSRTDPAMQQQVLALAQCSLRLAQVEFSRFHRLWASRNAAVRRALTGVFPPF